MLKLFDDAESDSDVEIKTNSNYATHYNTWRKKEELYKLKQRYGDQSVANNLLENSESSSSEDEDEPEVTEEFEKDFFKTLSSLKNKDPKIYDKNVTFFENKPEDYVSKTKKKKEEPMFLKDYERKLLLEKGAEFEENVEESKYDPRSTSPTYVEEQQKLKETLKAALDDENDDNNENLGGLFSKRQKTKEELEKEEKDFKQWLKGNKDKLENQDEETALKPLKEYWTKPDLDDSEKFLRDYLLNKKYLENDDENHIPTYEEIIHDSDDGFSEDENQIEKQEEFEHKYNFRYEEPDEEFIKRYPRTMEHSVRKTDDRRKVKRAEIKERKEEEKKQKQEDIKQLKILKRQEIEEKIKKLKEITGNDHLAFKEIDIDADFDPEEHDKRMEELFNEEYYNKEEGDNKPEFSDLEEELGPWSEKNELHCEDDNFIMDCDYDPVAAKLEKKNKRKRKKPTKSDRSKDLDDLPVEENDSRYQEYMDELYKLDCEDMIGDLPCRFKYREVIPNDFGLTVEEILLANDKELNRWCSLGKTTQIRPEHQERYDIIAYRKKAMNEQNKKKYLPSLYAQELEEDDELEKKIKQEMSEENENKKKNKKSKANLRNIEETYTNKEVKDEPEKQEMPEEMDEKIANIHEKKKNKKNKANMKNIEETYTNKEIKEDELENQEMSEEIDKKIVHVHEKKKNKKNKANMKSIEKTYSNKEIKKDELEKQETPEESDEKIINVHEKNKKNKTNMKNIEETCANKKTKSKSKTTKRQKMFDVTQNSDSEVKTKLKNPETSMEKLQKTEYVLTRRQKKNKKKCLSKTEPTDSNKLKQKTNNRKRKLSISENSSSNNKNSTPNKKRKLNKKSEPADVNMTLSKSRLEAYGINHKKFINKLKYKK